MELWEGFLDCCKDFDNRNDNGGQLINCLKTQEGLLRPETTKHLLSIGPGNGKVDHWLVSSLPNLVSYTAVEPDVRALETVKGRLEEFQAIEKHYVNDIMQTYTGPTSSPDLILMSHVAYYFGDAFEQEMGRALSWLNKNGGRIFLIHDEGSYHKELDSEFDVHAIKLKSLNELRGHLTNMGVSFTESAMDYTIDVSDPGATYYGFVSVLLNKRLTKEQTDKALDILHKYLVPGTKKMHCSQSLFVIQNTSNSED